MTIYSIGFTQRSAEDFFTTLKRAGIRRLLDVRLNNTSQLAAFAKKDDLTYFLKAICGIEYEHEPLLAPTQEILDAARKGKSDWAAWERDFNALMRARQIEKKLARTRFERPTVLLCSEFKAEHCHRRLVLEYLQKKWGGVEVVHL